MKKMILFKSFLSGCLAIFLYESIDGFGIFKRRWNVWKMNRGRVSSCQNGEISISKNRRQYARNAGSHLLNISETEYDHFSRQEGFLRNADESLIGKYEKIQFCIDP